MDFNWKNAFPNTPEGFHSRVNDTLNNLSENKEMDIMRISKKLTWKKAAVIAAVATLTLGTGAFAAGKIDGYIGCTTKQDIYKTVPSEEQMQKDYGFSPTIPDAFTNGYTYKQTDAGKTSSIDDCGNKLETVNELDVDYQKGSDTVTLFTNKCLNPDEYEDRTEKTQTFGETDVYYSYDLYKLIPEDYKMTEQDKKDEESGKYVFSCGDKGTKISIESVQSVCWLKDGIEYCLLATDSDLTKDEMVQMAGEVIE